MAVQSSVWLDLMRREYLRRFTPGGGSAIKFVMGDGPALEQIRRSLGEIASERHLHFVPIDGASTKIHMVQDVFFAIARSIDWEGLAQTWVETTFARNQYRWPRPGESAALKEVAAANDVDELLLRREFQRWLTRHVMQDRELAQDFRTAMTNLCLLRLEMGDERATAPVIEWLRGELRTIGPVRQVPISAKITRHNGRSMLRSLCHWLRLCGTTGVVATLDLTQLGRTGAAATENALRYSPAAVMDAYEVLRQVIDDAESFKGLFLAVLVDPTFRDEDSKRGVTAYRALKERIWPDVHARAHENPLTPLIQIGEETQTAAAAFSEPLEMPFNEERVAIEALRAGVPNRAAIRQLGSSEAELCEQFIGKLRRNREAPAAGRPIEGEIVAGGFGSGKSHLLGFLAEQALKENHVVSLLPVSKETPLFDPQRMYAAAMRNAIVPNVNDDVMTAIISRLDPTSDGFADLEAWASDDRSGLSALFPALLYLIPKQTTTAEDIATIARFLGGSQLGVAKVRQWLRAAGASKLFGITATRAADLAIQRLRFAPRLFQAAGYGGWCILIDEVELIGRYSALQRAKSYAEICRWLGFDNAVGVPGIVSVATITDDFKDQVLYGRLDQEKAPAALRGRGLEEPARLAEIAMRRLERGFPYLSPPGEDRLHRSLDRVRHLYAESYSWPAEAADIGERRAGSTMREFIKAWITVWDIRRIYGESDQVETETLAPDYQEGPELEQLPPLESVEE
jgi:hypothetical protein